MVSSSYHAAIIAALAIIFSNLFVTCVLAEVVVDFEGHGGQQIRGGYLYFPHAYVRFTGQVDTTGEIVDEAVGFTAANPGPHLLFFSGSGTLARPDQRYLSEGKRYFRIKISDEVFQSIRSRLNYWRSGPGSTYDLRRRNCITFVAEMARMTGLWTPAESTLSPNTFLSEMAALNAKPPPVDVQSRPRLQAGQSPEMPGSRMQKEPPDLERPDYDRYRR